jgi:methylmalonyl-CoA/ethylmalonyl-CoA epimerase
VQIHFDHVALAGRQRDPLRDFILDLVGGRVIVQQRDPQVEQGFRGVQIDVGGALLEVIEPTSPTSFLHPYLAKYGPGLHHLTWYVAGLDAFLDRLLARGVALTGVEREADGRVSNAFIRPSASFGVLVQFRPAVDTPREKQRQALDWQDLPPPRPLRGRLTATTIAAADGVAALAFFHETLGGEVGPPERRGAATVQPLRTGGTTIEIISPADEAPLPHAAGGALHSVTFELTAFQETLAAARALGGTLLPGEREGVAYLGRDNPTGALFRLVDASRP